MKTSWVPSLVADLHPEIRHPSNSKLFQHFVGPTDLNDLTRWFNYSRWIRTLRADCTTESQTSLFGHEFGISLSRLICAREYNGRLVCLPILPALRSVRWEPCDEPVTVGLLGLLVTLTSGTLVDFEITPPFELDGAIYATSWVSLLEGLQRFTKSLKRIDLGRSFARGAAYPETTLRLCDLFRELEVEELGLSESMMLRSEVLQLVVQMPQLRRLTFYGSDEIPESYVVTYPAETLKSVTELEGSVPGLVALLMPRGMPFGNLVSLGWGDRGDWVPSAQWKEIYTLLELVGNRCPHLEELEIHCRVRNGSIDTLPESCALQSLRGCHHLWRLNLKLLPTEESACPTAFNIPDAGWLALAKACPSIRNIRYYVGTWLASGFPNQYPFSQRPQATLRALGHLLSNCPLLHHLKIPLVATGMRTIPEDELRRVEESRALRGLSLVQSWQGHDVEELAQGLDRLTKCSSAILYIVDTRLDGTFVEDGEDPLPLEPDEVARREYWSTVKALLLSMRETRHGKTQE